MKQLKPKQAHKICILIFFIGTIVGFTGIFLDKSMLSLLGIILLIGAVAFRFMFFKCPYCKKYLGRSSGEKCPYCGKEIGK